MLLRFLICAPLILSGCSEQSESVDDSRFVGTWAIENGLNWAYRGSLYDFREDGTLDHRRAVAWDNSSAPVGGVELYEVDGHCVGTGMGCPLLTTCSFGDRWAALSQTLVEFQLDCDDGRGRTVVLAFSDDVSQNAAGTRVELADVDYVADGWELTAHLFTRCPGDENCLRDPQ
jgi:hypothetical protein